MLKRIKYVSRMARPLSEAEIEDLSFGASAKNEALGITGVLATADGMFLQVLEGPPAEVDRIYRRIVADERHSQVLLLNEQFVEDRLFPAWFMRYVDLNADDDGERWEPLRAMLESIVQQRIHIERMSDVLERALWRELHVTQ